MARAIAILAVTQLVGWGTTFNLCAVTGPAMAADLAISLPQVLFGPTIMLVTMAILSPVLPRAMASFGVGGTMAGGSLVACAGLALLGSAAGQPAFYAAWTIIGVAGTAMLTTPAQIALAAIAGDRSRRALGALVILSGLSSSIFWPLTASIQAEFGWRSACWIFAGLNLVVCLPLHLFALARTAHPRVAPPAIPPAETGGAVFFLIATAVSLNGFISWGFSLTIIVLLADRGLPMAQAVMLASMLGIVQIFARALDFSGGNRWDGLTTSRAAAMLLPVGLGVLLFGGSPLIAAAFIAIYGFATGAMAVSRATLPLVFFPGDAYARASARLALPLNLSFAAAPPFFASVQSGFGSQAVLGLAMALSLAALCVLLLLQRPQAAGLPAASDR